MQDQLLILGVGNVLMSDDGVGVHVARRLQSMAPPPHVQIVEGGTLGIELIEFFRDKDRAIIVDAMQTEEAPGTLFCFSLSEAQTFIRQKKMSSHYVTVFDVLPLASHLGVRTSKIDIIGVQPARISPGVELSTEVESKMPILISLLQEEISAT